MVEAASINATSENEQHLDKAMVARDRPVRGDIDRLADEPPKIVDMEMNGERIPFELDTGASLSIIDEKTWHKLCRPQLQKAEVAATAFDNKRIMFQGQVPLQFKFAGKQAIIDVHVFKEASHSLSERDMVRKLQIDCRPHYEMIHSVAQTSKVEIKKESVRILNNNERLFQEGMGKCTILRAELKFKNEAVVPKFSRARPVPIALRIKVEAKLEEMVRNGTIQRVEHSKWATPLAAVSKAGGKIWVCGDYKVTVIPHLDINRYKLPEPDDLFHMLHGGKKFSKVDFSDAYIIAYIIASAPAIFQRIMEETLAGIECTLIYLDDSTVTGPDDKTRLERLEKVLNSNRLN
ncbi:hypothetical protein V3C99_018134 [Haemonchus contortus]|uniref:Reverse transcriptase domain-containing protein n=1 Tax=Haemonchus contortus TaxID=6289 RepID=A0A7I4Z2Y1_HAECO|nr:uncharacterized protein K02A2.6-like [Haemonchus contortus]